MKQEATARGIRAKESLKIHHFTFVSRVEFSDFSTRRLQCQECWSPYAWTWCWLKCKIKKQQARELQRMHHNTNDGQEFWKQLCTTYDYRSTELLLCMMIILASLQWMKQRVHSPSLASILAWKLWTLFTLLRLLFTRIVIKSCIPWTISRLPWPVALCCVNRQLLGSYQHQETGTHFQFKVNHIPTISQP